ncbi:MAG: hypothetical protein KF752_07000 [Pirellulaceae bacterium]|nr:hypothetical protein [Pirellulaceae bacterium]
MCMRFASLTLGWVSLWILNCWVAFGQDAQQWTSLDGKTVSGQFLRLDDKAVVLQLSSGKQVTVKLSALSLESHLQALKLANPGAFSKELLRAPIEVQPQVPADLLSIEAILASSFSENPTIDAFLQATCNQWQRGNTFVNWHALPPKIQRDMAAHIAGHMNALGPSGCQQMRTVFGSLANIVSKKSDWVLGSPMLQSPVAGGLTVAELHERWPSVVGYWRAMADESLWHADNFQSDRIVPWLANLSVAAGFLKQVDPRLYQARYEITSQTADRAQARLTVGLQSAHSLDFQKFGNIWLVPEKMNQLQADIAKHATPELRARSAKKILEMLQGLQPLLKQLEQAKSQQEFQQLLANFKFPGFPVPSAIVPTEFLGDWAGVPGLDGALLGIYANPSDR